MSHSLTVRGLNAVAALAAELAARIQAGDVVLLQGPLGAGKTTFAQALAQQLGVEERVTSPSYTIVAEYPARGWGINRLIHADLYRLSAEEAAREGAVQELAARAGEAGRLTVIEWAEKLATAWPRGWRLTFAFGETESERVITVETWPNEIAWRS